MCYDAFSSKGKLHLRRPSLAWLDFAREHTVARAQHPDPENGRTARNGHQKGNQRVRVTLERLCPGADKPDFFLTIRQKRVDLTSDPLLALLG